MLTIEDAFQLTREDPVVQAMQPFVKEVSVAQHQAIAVQSDAVAQLRNAAKTRAAAMRIRTVAPTGATLDHAADLAVAILGSRVVMAKRAALKIRLAVQMVAVWLEKANAVLVVAVNRVRPVVAMPAVVGLGRHVGMMGIVPRACLLSLLVEPLE
jgi:hypothetical protein